MTQLVLEIPENQDLELLLALFKRLNLRFVHRTILDDTNEPLTAQDADLNLILAGLPPKDNFEAYIRDFEDSRKDNVLPFREN
jgi:hypothetical protein